MKFQSACCYKSELMKLFTIVDAVPMLSYNNYLIRRISSYYIFFNNFFQYKEYIRRDRLNYNVFDTTDFQLQSIVYYYIKFEYEIKDITFYILEEIVYLQYL